MTDELPKGLDDFRSGYFAGSREDYRPRGSDGQHPRTCFVGCSDSGAERS